MLAWQVGTTHIVLSPLEFDAPAGRALARDAERATGLLTDHFRRQAETTLIAGGAASPSVE
jgi:hypothetical protein